jgi:hypothetical protein
MTNKPKVTCTETDLSHPFLNAQMREAHVRMDDAEFLDMIIPPREKHPHVMVLSCPTSPNRSSFFDRMRHVLPKHQVWDEAHVPVKRFELHEHQRQAMDWFDRQPNLRLDLDAFGATHFNFESVHHHNIRRLPMLIDPWMPDGVMRFETAPGLGQSFFIDYKYGVTMLTDEYIAPPQQKSPKDWDKNAQHWYRAAMGGKPMMNMAIAAYRASKHSIYQPEFDWENQREARRKLHFIKHVNVGTVGHIDWGNNRLKRTRPYVTGYLADCIREAIKEFK